MALFVGSRYRGLKVTEIIENDGTRKLFLHLRNTLNPETMKDKYSIYTVQQGDELDLIMKKHGMTPDQWWIIAELNNIFFAFDIAPGQKIVIPDISILENLSS